MRARPRALCIRARPSPVTPDFMERVLDEWIRALALHAELVVMDEDFDLARACDAHRPDFIVFEGLCTLRPEPLEIAAPHCHPAIPRAMFLNVDPHDAMRPHIYRMVERFGVEAIFGYDSDHEEQMPDLAGMTYSAPMFVDPALHREYGLEKTIAVTVFGGFAEPNFYAWRAASIPLLQSRFPTLVVPHPGYRRTTPAPFAAFGEAYARLLNQSRFALADGTRLDYMVRKHLEIPACGAILVAPPSPALADYGHADMVTCITGHGRALADRIAAVAAEPELEARIRRAGQALVQERHVPARWRVIVDWFFARAAASSGQVVQQQGMFGGFAAVAGDAGTPRCRDLPVRRNEVTAILHAGRAVILDEGAPEAALESAEASLRIAAGWLAHLTEPWLLIAAIRLLRGDAEGARPCLLRPSAIQFARHAPHIAREARRVCIDPVETAWLLLTASLLDDAALARLACDHAHEAAHVAIRRVLWLLEEETGTLPMPAPADRPSIHWLGREKPGAWCGLMRRILRAHGRPAPACLAEPAAALEHVR